MSRLRWLAVCGGALAAAALAAALLAGWLAPFSPEEQFRDSVKLPPGAAAQAEDQAVAGDRHFRWGTDLNGRDVYSRVLYGAQVSLIAGVGATMLNLLIGVLLGLVAGYFGGWLDTVLMRVTDVFFAFPGTLLAIILLATLNQPDARSALQSALPGVDIGLFGIVFALGLTGWTGISRVVRGQTLALKEREFIESARAIGCGDARIIFVHILPNCLAPIIVLGTLQVAYNILSEAGLSFLGLGVQPPAASWGGMLAEARPYLAEMPWWGFYPGLAIAATVLGFNLVGDGLRDALDPRLRLR